MSEPESDATKPATLPPVPKAAMIRTVHDVPNPEQFRPSRPQVDASQVGPIDLTPRGAMYVCRGMRILVPWTNVKYVELEPESEPEPPKRGRKR